MRIGVPRFEPIVRRLGKQCRSFCSQHLESKKVPVTILTGYLGAGKTTLLNRILAENHGKRIAVIQNEFGAIAIDDQLVVAHEQLDGEEIFHTTNGCLRTSSPCRRSPSTGSS